MSVKCNSFSYLLFEKISPNATVPTKGSIGSAGYDLYSAYEYDIPSKETSLILTDIRLVIPNEMYGRIAPRSGLALKHSIDVLAGVVDSDYRGNICVLLINHGTKNNQLK